MLHIRNCDSSIANTINIAWFPSLICNYKCSYCYVRNNNLDFLNQENLNLFFKFLKNQKTNKVDLQILGGEPTIIKNIQEILDTICEIDNINTNVVTNGSNLKNISIPNKISIDVSIHYEFITTDYIKNIKQGLEKQNCKKNLIVNVRNDLNKYEIENIKKYIKILKQMKKSYAKIIFVTQTVL